MNAADLGPLELEPDPQAERRRMERRELLRIAAQRALDLHEQLGHLDAEQLRIARHWASMPPLPVALSSGEQK